MIIGISGKIGSGKDTVGNIIHYLNSVHSKSEYNNNIDYSNVMNNWSTKKFADKLKDIVCLLLNCTRQQLEDREFKEKELGKNWNTTFYNIIDNQGCLLEKHYTKEEAETYLSYWDDSITVNYPPEIEEVNQIMTPRLMLQLIGTECGRNIIHPDIWVNTLMSEYKPKVTYQMEVLDLGASDLQREKIGKPIHDEYPNWIITDMRFPNELKAVKDRNGITIRINRPTDILEMGQIMPKEHLSEVSLDNIIFDYVIYNNGSIKELVKKVKKILEDIKIKKLEYYD